VTALEIAHEGGVPVPVSAGVLEEWTAAIGALGRQADHTEIASYVEARAGVQLTEPQAGTSASTKEKEEQE
jgi:3-hydroxyisobutyrate dehydrogenase